MKKIEFFYKSKDNETNIRAVKYIPEKEIVGIFQIAHGMCEYIDRYDKFAEFLCENGYLVVGNDHLGHGESVKDKELLGYFAPKDGYKIVLEDIHELTTLIKKEYKDLPIYLLGHSMGSFFARFYITKYANEIDGVIIMGTGQQNKATLAAGKVTCRSVAINKGWNYRSSLLQAMSIGAYNKKWEPSKTHCDWLTKDNAIVEKYYCDPKCNYRFTVNGFYNLFSVIEEVVNKNNLLKMPKDLKVLITSGKDDPVGNFGKDPKALYDIFKKIGMNDVSLKLYENDRHEILNELDKDNVYNDILKWLKKD